MESHANGMLIEGGGNKETRCGLFFCYEWFLLML